MKQDRSFIIRILVAVGLVYGGWNYVVRPAQAKLDLLKQSRETQKSLVAQAGSDFESRLDATNKAHEMVHLAGDRVISVFVDEEDQESVRDLIESHARTFNVGINRIEPLRMTEYTSNSTKNRYGEKPEDSKDFRFVGETIRVELDGAFANMAGFLHCLDAQSPTIKLETFRMIPSNGGNARMIAQFVKYELMDAPIELVHSNATNTSTLSFEE